MVHCTPNNRLEFMISTQIYVLTNKQRVLRYWPNCAKVWRFGFATWILFISQDSKPGAQPSRSGTKFVGPLISLDWIMFCSKKILDQKSSGSENHFWIKSFYNKNTNWIQFIWIKRLFDKKLKKLDATFFWTQNHSDPKS